MCTKHEDKKLSAPRNYVYFYTYIINTSMEKCGGTGYNTWPNLNSNTFSNSEIDVKYIMDNAVYA